MSASARTTHVTLPKGATLPVGITIERPQPGCDRHAALFYLHGGGLLYGVRDDLPRRYVDIILGRGLTLVTADYPLAPQAQIGAILNAVEEVFRSSSDLLPAGRTFLCGRSAGAYLALMLAHQLGQSGEAPAGVADFYGYCNLAKMRAALFQPSLHYRRTYALVAPRTARRLAGTEPLSSAPLRSNVALASTSTRVRPATGDRSLRSPHPTSTPSLSMPRPSRISLPSSSPQAGTTRMCPSRMPRRWRRRPPRPRPSSSTREGTTSIATWRVPKEWRPGTPASTGQGGRSCSPIPIVHLALVP